MPRGYVLAFLATVGLFLSGCSYDVHLQGRRVYPSKKEQPVEWLRPTSLQGWDGVPLFDRSGRHEFFWRQNEPQKKSAPPSSPPPSPPPLRKERTVPDPYDPSPDSESAVKPRMAAA